MEIAGKVLEEVRQRTRHFLEQVGLEYLTLDRLSSTLSGGRVAADSAGDFAGIAPGGRAVCAG